MMKMTRNVVMLAMLGQAARPCCLISPATTIIQVEVNFLKLVRMFEIVMISTLGHMYTDFDNNDARDSDPFF